MSETFSKWQGIFVRLVAELVIIVTGVTIALWADSWVARRNDQANETARLVALHANVRDTLASLRDARTNGTGAADALRRLVLLQQGDRDDDEVAELLRYGLLFGPTFFPELSVYDDLKNSGELALLTSTELRRSLATMDARLEYVRLAQSDLLAVLQLNVGPYMISHIDLLPFYGSLSGLGDSFEESRLDLDFTSEREFRNVVLLKLDLVTVLEMALEEAEAALTAVQQIIESQLGIEPG